MSVLVDDYITHRRKLGLLLRAEGSGIQAFGRYCDRIRHRGPITEALAVRWATLSKASTVQHARRLDMVRRFATYRLLFDRATQVPRRGLLGPAYRRMAPYIFTASEIADLIRAAKRMGPADSLPPHTFSTLFGLLASTGLRISEALQLRRKDVDLKSNILSIIRTKFRKARLVPIHPSTVAALRSYSGIRDRLHPCSTTDAFFLTGNGAALGYWQAAFTFRMVRKKIRWRDARRPPRLHDFRHAFAVHRMLRWYDEGIELNRRIAALSTYLGHVDVESTYWYLSAAPELLAAAATRCEASAEKWRRR
jgi:integrase